MDGKVERSQAHRLTASWQHQHALTPATGLQLLALAIFIFMLALVGAFYPYNRGGLFTALIVLYALTAGIAGYVAASYYKQMEGGNWVRNLLVTCLIYCGPFFLIFCFNNTVAWIYGVSPGSCSWLRGCTPGCPRGPVTVFLSAAGWGDRVGL